MPQSITEDIKETAKLLVSERMLKLAPMIVYTACSSSVIASVFVPMMTASIK